MLPRSEQKQETRSRILASAAEALPQARVAPIAPLVFRKQRLSMISS